MYRLQGGRYSEIETSLALAPLTALQSTIFLEAFTQSVCVVVDRLPAASGLSGLFGDRSMAANQHRRGIAEKRWNG